ncbi:hypothetical protein NPIL_236351 [Nephila pilipes]|uniref:Uncharacterized protein n=1 Tax=Nephila pilipes TaxID=299642 RepID=A0A8X6N4U4_NEPPI|nr:hypothetical protein NPIL_236351 [Nephila pilipes]
MSEMHDLQASKEEFETAPIDMNALMTPTRHGLPNIFVDTCSSTDQSSSDVHSYHQVHFGIYDRIVHNTHDSLRENNQEEINHVIWKTLRGDHHAQYNCF